MILKLSFFRLIIFIVLSSCSFISLAQNPTGYIADWKNDAKAAYSIVHDDYGLAACDGIWQYGDTIAFNRGIKFVFGAYTEPCENRFVQPNGYSNLYDYAKNVMIGQHGHEIANHSYVHTSAVQLSWTPPGSGWGETPLGVNMDKEINRAHQSIIDGTGFVPQYYVYPYDQFTNASNQRLEDLGYIGSRTGWSGASPDDQSSGYHREGYENSDPANFYPNVNGFFRNGVEVFNEADGFKNWQSQLVELNQEIDNVIQSGMYANREFHNVGNSGWGAVKVDAYRGHMDYLKAKVDEGNLWVGTVSEIFTYQMQKLKYSPSISYVSSADRVYINWNDIGSQYDVDVASYLSSLSIKTPITLVINLDGLTGNYVVSQNSIDISVDKYYSINGKMYIDVYPHEGDVEIYKKSSNGNDYPYVDNVVANQNLNVNFTSFVVNLKNVFEDTETADNDLIFSAFGYECISVDISNGVATISAPSDWFGTNTITFQVEDEGGLTVTESFDVIVQGSFSSQTHYGCVPASIPGRIEAEDYDEGDEGEAFNEEYSQWENAPKADQYRPWDPVDVDTIGGTNDFGVGHTISGEWLEYTVNVITDADYTIDFNVASVDYGGSTPGKIELLIDGNSWMPATDMIFTGDWSTYEKFSYPNSLFLAAGKHVLRVSFQSGAVNLDYIDILASPTSANNTALKDAFKVYPNPASSFIKIKADYQTARIYSQMGELVQVSKKKDISLISLANGIYFVKLDDSPSMVKFIVSK